ncbi:glycosyltransferase [Pelagibacteraceae bacterium]|nr:glycosyltransferase [Pelagibacteraceae bacterium]
MKLFIDKKQKKEPKISIILPNYNSYKTILPTVASIINQSYKNWELIIVDDCSNEKTKKTLIKYKKIKKIKIIYLKKNKGAGYCRNLAIKNSNSYYIAFIDSDDLWEKDKLKLQINFMQNNNYHFTYTYYKTFSGNTQITKDIMTPEKFDFDSFTKNTSIATSTMIVKRTAANKIKFSDTKICEDYYYKCQILKKNKYAYCYPDYLMQYQIRKNSLQANRFRNLYWMWKINKDFNRFNIINNLISIFFISLNSLKKYGLR